MPADVKELTARAVNEAFDTWARQHPSLAAVINRIELSEQAAVSLRDSDAYRKAVAGYYRSLSEVELLNKLLSLAGPVIERLLSIH